MFVVVIIVYIAVDLAAWLPLINSATMSIMFGTGSVAFCICVLFVITDPILEELVWRVVLPSVLWYGYVDWYWIVLCNPSCLFARLLSAAPVVWYSYVIVYVVAFVGHMKLCMLRDGGSLVCSSLFHFGVSILLVVRALIRSLQQSNSFIVL